MLEEYVINFAIYLLYHKFLEKVGHIATPQISLKLGQSSLTTNIG